MSPHWAGMTQSHLSDRDQPGSALSRSECVPRLAPDLCSDASYAYARSSPGQNPPGAAPAEVVWAAAICGAPAIKLANAIPETNWVKVLAMSDVTRALICMAIVSCTLRLKRTS